MARSKKVQAAIDDAMSMHVAEGQVGLGVDIVEVSRIREILKRSPAFSRRAFSQEEQNYCNATADPALHYATRFAAKEAVVKALGTGFAEGIGVRDIEVRRSKNGRPFAVLTGNAKRKAVDMGVREIPISLSYTATDAIACAIAITEASIRAGEKRVDMTEELSRQFKEARGMLDEIPAQKSECVNSSVVIPDAKFANL
ncbi:holo-ACP synthase [Adlercreutzia sp. ZJ304]|uniref:holo-ACP synthase n=1 Tax=Adlercreutzia sp. ZJ304 TaxID=2709791 RepID=UPI0013EB9A7A|nr:holo-ACP synthase [Adlercreutzia sp. ZJ304]